jgi:hypothetical protein
MNNDLRPKPDVDAAAADPFLMKLRTLCESLPRAREIRYRLEEMERRVLEMYADSTGTT